MSLSAAFRRLWPGFVGMGVAAVFLVGLIVAPRMDTGACRGSYPLACPIVEIVSGWFTATVIGLLVSVLSIFLISATSLSKVRTAGVVVGFVLLAVVMVLGANFSVAHSTELRY